MGRFFISSFVDENYKSFFRDLRRDLNKYQRNILFNDLEQLHFNYKYLTDKLTTFDIDSITENLSSEIESVNITEFTLPLEKLSWGDNYQQKNTEFFQSAENTASFRNLTGWIHGITASSSGQVVRRKDPPKFNGVIKLGNIKTNTSSKDEKEIIDILANSVYPKDVLVSQFHLIEATLYKQKSQYKIINTFKLKKFTQNVESV